MPVKVRRGLGLLVVAVIAFGVTFLLGQVATAAREDAPAVLYVIAWLALLMATLTVVGCTVVGLVLVAWGLLRD